MNIKQMTIVLTGLWLIDSPLWAQVTPERLEP
jgi:hypothetical protein